MEGCAATLAHERAEQKRTGTGKERNVECNGEGKRENEKKECAGANAWGRGHKRITSHATGLNPPLNSLSCGSRARARLS